MQTVSNSRQVNHPWCSGGKTSMTMETRSPTARTPTLLDQQEDRSDNWFTKSCQPEKSWNSQL